jgi:hypothetical protein
MCLIQISTPRLNFLSLVFGQCKYAPLPLLGQRKFALTARNEVFSILGFKVCLEKFLKFFTLRKLQRLDPLIFGEAVLLK